MKHGNFEKQIRDCACIQGLFTKKANSFVSVRSFSSCLLVWISLVYFYFLFRRDKNCIELLRKILDKFEKHPL